MDTQASIQLEESTSVVCVTTSTYKRHPGEVSINDDEVILLYIEAFLISTCKSVSPAELALVKKSTPGLFFRCRSTLACRHSPSSTLGINKKGFLGYKRIVGIEV